LFKELLRTHWIAGLPRHLGLPDGIKRALLAYCEYDGALRLSKTRRAGARSPRLWRFWVWLPAKQPIKETHASALCPAR
jgi:hypothetical protein